MDETREQPGKSRRRFLALLGAAGVAWVLALLYPIQKYLAPLPPENPFDEEGKAEVAALTAADVATPGTGGNGGYGTRGVILFRDRNGVLKAFDSKCTHAGCTVEFDGERLYCHCHGGVYDLNGKNIAGPPPKPLTPLEALEIDGKLYVKRLSNEV